MSCIEQCFYVAVVFLWNEHVGIPQHHLWALDVMQAMYPTMRGRRASHLKLEE